MNEGQNHRSTRSAVACADGSACPGRASLGHRPRGAAAEGNRNAQPHGFYAHRDVPDPGWTIDTLMGRSHCQACEAKRQSNLFECIGRLLDDDQTDPRDIARLFALHRVSAARLERVLQEREKTHWATGRLRTIAALAATAAAGLPAAGTGAAGLLASGTPAADRSAGRKPVVQR